ncbi:MAG: LysR family transcriptional regulator [Anaerovoracaceae bacterium]
MKIEQLKQLIEIVECGSINKAAQNMFMSQSALSNSVKNLEKEFNKPILQRGSRGISLTGFGMEVYNNAKYIASQIDILKNRGDDSEYKEELSISNMYSPLANEIFIEFYKKYKKKNYSLAIKDCPISTILSDVVNGISEIGIISLFADSKDSYLNYMREKGIKYTKIAKKKLYVVIGPNNPLYRIETDEIKLEDLRDFPFVIYDDGNPETTLEKLVLGSGKEKCNISLSNMGAIMTFVNQTDGFTLDFNNKKSFEKFQLYKELRFIKVKNQPLESEFGWIMRKDYILSPIATEYINELTKVAVKIEKENHLDE